MSHTKAAFRQVKPLFVSVVDGTTVTDGDFNVLHYASAAACIQAAFDSIKTLGGTVRIRSGAYSIATEINTSGQTQAVVIEGDGGTVLTQAAAVNVFNIKSSGITIQDMTIMAGNFAADVIYGQSATTTLGYIFLNRLNIVDIAANALNRGLILIEEHGVDSLSAIEIKNCILSFNNLTHMAVEIRGAASNIEIHSNFLSGKARRGIAFTAPVTANRSGGGTIRIYNNTLQLGDIADLTSTEGICVYGWREPVFIYDNSVLMHNGAVAGSIGGIVMGYSNMTGSAYSIRGAIHNNSVRTTSSCPDAQTIYLLGHDAVNALSMVTITGNHCTMFNAAALYNMLLLNCIGLCVQGNALETNSVVANHGPVYCGSVQTSVIGLNRQFYQADNPPLTANSSYVSDQIVKVWGHLTCGGAGAVTIDRDYNIASASYAGNLLTINFDRSFNAANNYSVSATAHIPMFAPFHVVAKTLNAGSCVLGSLLPAAGGGFTADNWNAGEQVCFSAFGTSANG